MHVSHIQLPSPTLICRRLIVSCLGCSTVTVTTGRQTVHGSTFPRGSKSILGQKFPEAPADGVTVGRGRNGKELGEADCSESIQVSGNAAGVAPDDGISRIIVSKSESKSEN